MDRLIESLNERAGSEGQTYRPSFYRCDIATERKALEGLLNSDRCLRVYDQLHGQLEELVKCERPSKSYNPEELQQAVEDHLKGTALWEYGVWVHYPWSGQLVHLLDEEEFIRIRTDRNRNKITREEQQVLAGKKVGVIGLSVGQSVSITMAMERSFGEIRLADPDTLELSNLNRIRSGVHAMGVNKAINVAREIAEIDPFLKVVCFTEGVSRDNIDRFFTEGGELDLLVEECDSVEMKIMARHIAKAWRIPVVMDTSDRGMIDIERFDLESERPIFHGALEHLELHKNGEPMDSAMRLRISKAIIGLDTISSRLRRSLELIGTELLTWPQLASAVGLGGSATAEVVRWILLGSSIPSSRNYIDMEQLMPLLHIEDVVETPNQLPEHG